VSPILVRPVREQLEHDRIIRQLQAKFRRKYEAGINPGTEQNAPVGSGPTPYFPDLVLTSLDRGRKVQAVVEVETGESVNHLEALAQWTHFSQLRVPFHLYVPAGMVDVARRLAEDNHVYVSEIWSYNAVGDQIRFVLVHRNKEAPPPLPRKAATPAAPKPAAATTSAPKSVVVTKTPPSSKAAPARKSAAAPKKAAAPVKNAKNGKKKAPMKKAAPAKKAAKKRK
jgi:hypothetical protein